ncbi:hypothetical protein C8Q79DRAFT_313480 [Trametes meyenii]|nr:hypothetical protein C8Q79DRAFT_313480 [Trametes meyenii]
MVALRIRMRTPGGRLRDDSMEINLDFTTGCTPDRARSRMPSNDGDDEAKVHSYQDMTVSIIIKHYTKRLEKQGFGSYSFFDPPMPEDDEDGIWVRKDLPPSNMNDLRRTNVGGLGQVSAISQETFNWHLDHFYEQPMSIFKTWSRGTSFNASFRRPRIRLLSGMQAVLLVNIGTRSFVHFQKGVELPPPTPQQTKTMGQANIVDAVCLAFKVKIETRTYEDLRSRDEALSGAYQDGRELDYLVLDLSHAEFLPAHSDSVKFQSRGGKASAHHFQESLIAYIIKGYFNALQRGGLHVIASFPTLGNGDSIIPSYTPRSVRYRIHSSINITVDNWSTVFSDYPACQPALFAYDSSKAPDNVETSLSRFWIPRFPSFDTGFSQSQSRTSRSSSLSW